MGFMLPAGVINTDMAFLFASETLPLGILTKEVDDLTLVSISYNNLTIDSSVETWGFTVDVTSNPELVVSYPEASSDGTALRFLLSGGIAGQQYNIGIAVTFQNTSTRDDVLTVNVPSSDCGCEIINPVPALYSQLPLGTQGYVNTGVRYFWGNIPPTNPGLLDQWYDTVSNTLYEWTTDGNLFSWKVLIAQNTVNEAPQNSTLYNRYNGQWVPDPIQVDAPVDSRYYVRSNNAWILDPVQSGAGFLSLSGGTMVGPITLAADPVAPLQPVTLQYFNSNFPPIPAASTSLPFMDGIASVGAGITYARADHIHPSDTSLYPASNPSNYQTAAQVTASLGAYLPLIGGTLTGPLIVADSSTSDVANLTINSPNNTNGADIKLIGNGVVTPSKTIRAYGGSLQVVNNAYSGVIFQIGDDGTVNFTGPAILPADPTAPLQAATKQYVDAHISSGGGSVTISDTPPASPTVGQLWWDSVGGQLYVWYNDGTSSQWVVANSGGGGGGGTGGIADAPNDGTSYARNSTNWVHLTHSDITDWAANISQPSNAAPLMDGIAVAGSSALYARGDHVHPVDTSRYAASNPAGYVTSAGAASAAPVQSVAGKIGAVTLVHTDITDWATYVSQPSNANPLMNGTVAPGSSALYARGDHVHPTDTSLYPMSNPSGYQTAAQVTASLGPYALTANVPVAATTVPLMDGTAAVGVGTTWARADHVHPSDTSLLPWISDTPPVSPKVGALWWDSVGGQLYIWYNDGNSIQWVMANNLGANLANYLPLVGGTLTGPLTLAANPAAPLQSATKQYVDGIGLPIGDNLITNGDMRIDQRNNGATGTVTGYTADRWQYVATQAGKIQWLRGTPSLAPGFQYQLGMVSQSAYVLVASDYFIIQQPIEADMITALGWGTANAQPVTLSFWAYSSTLTGMFGGALRNANRVYLFSFSLPTAAAWTKIILTIPGDTVGPWTLSGNGVGVYLSFDLGSAANVRGVAGAWGAAGPIGVTGAVSIVATNAAGFYITGVKLEVGSVATPFNRQSLAKSLADCQRYWEKSYDLATVPGTVTNNGSFLSYVTGLNGAGVNNISWTPLFKTTKRAVPTITMYSNTSGASGKIHDAAGNGDVTPSMYSVGMSCFSGWGAAAAAATSANLTGQWTADAEL